MDNDYLRQMEPVQEPGQASAGMEAAPQKKGFPLFAIPALVMLTLMLAVFAFEVFLSLHKNNILDTFNSKFIGTLNYEKLIRIASFPIALEGSLVFRLVQLGISGMLAAGFNALFYAMKKPRTVLTFACLWLIPACLPYLTMSLATIRTTLIDNSGILFYFCTTVVQTTSVFCFCGGLFTFMNLKKHERHGGGPYYGLLIGILVFLLGALSTSALHHGATNALMRGTTLDILNYKQLTNLQFGLGAAGGVMKTVMQIILAIIPMIVLCILARKKSTKGKMTWSALWVFLAIPAGLTLLMLLQGVFAGDTQGSAVFNSVMVVLIGGSFGGLMAYSFIHLLRRVPSFLFGLIAMILTASMSCLVSKYVIMNDMGMRETVWPQVLTAAFDGRLILISTVLAFALRDYHETRPGCLVIAAALLAGAFLWGEITVASLSYTRSYTVSLLTLRVMTNTVDPKYTAVVQGQAEAIRTGYQWLLAVPPLLLGTGAALLLKHAFDELKDPLKG